MFGKENANLEIHDTTIIIYLCKFNIRKKSVSSVIFFIRKIKYFISSNENVDRYSGALLKTSNIVQLEIYFEILWFKNNNNYKNLMNRSYFINLLPQKYFLGNVTFKDIIINEDRYSNHKYDKRDKICFQKSK